MKIRLDVFGVEVGGFAFVFWGALFEEGADAFEVVVALIDAGAVGIDALEALGGEDGGCLAEDTELALDGADGHDAVATQWGKEMLLEESVEFLGGGDAIDESYVEGIVGRDRLSKEEHLACLVDAELVDKMHDAGGVVGDAYLSRGDGKGGVVAADNHVAREAEVASTSPYATIYTGNDRNWRFLNTTNQLFHRNIVCQRVFTILGQFTDVVTCTPDAFTALCFDYDADALLVIAILNGVLQFGTHCFAEAVEVVGVLHLDVADAIFDFFVYYHSVIKS